MNARVNRTAVLLGALSIVVTVILAIWLLRPQHGELRVAVFAPRGPLSRADVFIDGEKKCEAAPCLVTGLAAGPRTVQVVAPGFPPTTITEVVEPGKERLALVSLMGPDSAQQPVAAQAAAPVVPAAVAPAANGTELRVSSGTPGVHGRVDDVDRGALPLRLLDIAPGKHRIRFEAGDRYEALERPVQVDAGRVLDLGDVKLKLLKGRLKIDIAEGEARVTVEPTDGGRPELVRGPWPAVVDLDATHAWRVVARKSGYRDRSVEVSFSDAAPEKIVSLSLEPLSGGGARVARSAAPAREKSRAPAAEEPAEKPEPGGSGTLNINSLPSSRVLVDGIPVGNTPKVDFPVSAGVHTVTFIHPDLGKKTVSVTVKPGQAAVAAVRLKVAE